MSRHWSHFKKFRCGNGCEAYGHCPGHKMRIVYVATSDHTIVEIDPKEGDRPGSAGWQYLFDDGVFEAMIDLHDEAMAAMNAEMNARMQAAKEEECTTTPPQEAKSE